jgi:hypothetical protein
LEHNFSDYYFIYLGITLFWILVLIIVVSLRLFWRFLQNNKISHYVSFASIGLAFSFLGLSIGLLSGLSISPVVGVLIPALLTFFGGVLSYAFLFGKSQNSFENTLTLIIIVISVSFSLILGVDYGSSQRSKVEFLMKENELERKKNFEEFIFMLNNKPSEKIQENQVPPKSSPNKAATEANKKRKEEVKKKK